MLEMGSDKTEFVAIGEKGRRCGETHHNAKLSDAEVDLIRELYEDKEHTMAEISRKLHVKYSTVRMICLYERRAERPARFIKATKKRTKHNDG